MSVFHFLAAIANYQTKSVNDVKQGVHLFNLFGFCPEKRTSPPQTEYLDGLHQPVAKFKSS